MGSLTQNLVPATVPVHPLDQGGIKVDGATEDELDKLVRELARTVVSIRQLAEDLKVRWDEVIELSDRLYRDLNDKT